MRYAYTLFSCLLLSAWSARAQQQPLKVLFDATKAEMAGNADWVIDADRHDVGTGSESNPQRFPLPAQSGISAGTPETYWQGALSSWGVALAKRGFEVETLPIGARLTYGDATNAQDLSNYAVYVVDEPNIRFAAAEKTALLTYVKEGGGLLLISDHDQSDRNGDGWDSPKIWNDLLSTNSVQVNPFGFSFDLNNLVVNTTNVPALPGDSLLHGPAGNVAAMEYHNGATLTLNPTANPSVRGIIYRPGVSPTGLTGAFMAYARFGRGKVVALGDSSPADDGTGDPGDNLYNGWSAEANGDHARVLLNATIWLSIPKRTTLASREAASAGIRLYPNPATHLLHLTSPVKPAEVRWFNSLGQPVPVASVAETLHEQTYDLTALPTGLYVVQCLLPGGQAISQRVERR